MERMSDWILTQEKPRFEAVEFVIHVYYWQVGLILFREPWSGVCQCNADTCWTEDESKYFVQLIITARGCGWVGGRKLTLEKWQRARHCPSYITTRPRKLALVHLCLLLVTAAAGHVVSSTRARLQIDKLSPPLSLCYIITRFIIKNI